MTPEEQKKARKNIGYGYYEVSSQNAQKLATDEYWNYKTGWQVVSSSFELGNFQADDVYRRKIDVGAGYELVPEQEVKNAHGEFFDQVNWEFYVDDKWLGVALIEALGVNHTNYSNWPAVRRKTNMNTNNWVSVKTKMPPDFENEVFVAWEDNSRKPKLLVRNGERNIWTVDQKEYGFTHWQLVKVPEDVKKLDKEEIAFLEWKSKYFAYSSVESAREFWRAARAFGF